MWLALAAASPQPPLAGELQDTLSTGVVSTFDAAARVEDVEACVGAAIYAAGVPSVLRHGSDRTIIVAFNSMGRSVNAAVVLHQVAAGQLKVEVRARNRSFSQKIGAAIRACFGLAA